MTAFSLDYVYTRYYTNVKEFLGLFLNKDLVVFPVTMQYLESNFFHYQIIKISEVPLNISDVWDAEYTTK